MIDSLPGVLLRLSVCASAAIALVLLVRGPLRRRVDASLAYQAWLIVPLAMAAAALQPLFGVPLKALALLPALGPAPGSAFARILGPEPGPALAVHGGAGPGLAGWLLLAWACGALAVLIVFCLSQRAFVRGLGRLTLRAGVAYAAHPGAGPALLGLWRPQIVVPSDFAQRYSAAEQALIIAHEQVHAQRADALANTVLALMQCVFWFNPLVHLAAPRFRFDQELACDAVVMRHHPAQRRTYAGAMLKTQGGVSLTPSVCHWQSCHPLKERIMQLQHTSPTLSRRLAGRMLVAALAGVSVAAALAARAESVAVPAAPAATTAATSTAAAPGYAVAMTLRAGPDGAPQRILARTPSNFSVRLGEGEGGWSGDFVLTAVGSDQVMLRSKLSLNGKPVSEPSVLARLGASSTIRVAGNGGQGDLALEVTVTREGQSVPGA
jgi:beta-lactamase regulating signal transducer with metallopeptidase domain